MSSLAIPFGLGFPVLLSMRGTLGERNPAQVGLGRTAVDMLALLGVQSFSLRDAKDISSVVQGVHDLAEGARQIAPIVLEPELDP